MAIATKFVYFLTSPIGIIFSDDIPSNALHVPTFYAPRTKNLKVYILHFVIFELCGTIFAGLHLAGWNVGKDSGWRVHSVIMLITMFAAIPTIYVIVTNRWRFGLVLGLSILCYSALGARIFLIQRAFISLLQQQHGTAFCAVDWTKFIPHLR